jgi:rhodanese-related sulfurtransferase
MRFKIITSLIILFTISSFGMAIDSTTKSITVNDFKKELKNNKSIVVLDIRMQDELTGPLGKIDGSVNIPLQELEKKIHELDKFKSEYIFVISRSGIPSKLATEMLRDHGFIAVNVIGGMMAYRQSTE